MSVLNGTSPATAPDLFQLFKSADRNGDQQISTDEFKSFLAAVLGGLNTTNSIQAATPAATTAGIFAASDVSTDGLPYAAVPGFSLEKLQDPSHVNEKYTASVRLFSQALAATGAGPDANGLQKVVDWLNAHGATASASKDMLTINGDPAVDVITDIGGSNSMWWFHNLP